MRVFVDGSALEPSQGGIWTYARKIIPALARTPGIEVVIATESPEEFADAGVSAVAIDAGTLASPYRRLLWRERTLPRLAAQHRADLLLGVAHEVPLRRLPIPSVLIIHDVGAIARPDLYGRAKSVRFKLAIPRMVRRSAATVCVSRATRDDLLASVRVDADKIHVAGEGPSFEPFALERDDDDPYVLYAGSSLPHKNLATLVRAFEESPPLWARLVMVGPPLGAGVTFDAGSGRIEHRGFVSDSELRSLLAGASAVAMPSLYEGFGLPALDAMSLGIPVVASDIPSLREVVGDGGILVEHPLEHTEWRAAIAQLQSAELREDLAAGGAARAAAFTWESAAADLHAVLTQVVTE